MNERKIDMKARIVMIIMAVALLALPTMAQQQEWQSTSAMQTSGSNYTPQVNAVGATAAPSVATTTENYSSAKAPSGPRKIEGFNPATDTGQSTEFPIGDAMLPLSLMAIAFCGVMFYRRKKALN